MPDDSQEGHGTLIRGADGELYFLRDELMRAAKVTEPEMKKFLESAADEHFQKQPGAFSIKVGAIEKAMPITGPFQKPKLDMVASSTVMCPGTMKIGAIKINPAVGIRTKRF